MGNHPFNAFALFSHLKGLPKILLSKWLCGRRIMQMKGPMDEFCSSWWQTVLVATIHSMPTYESVATKGHVLRRDLRCTVCRWLDVLLLFGKWEPLTGRREKVMNEGHVKPTGNTCRNLAEVGNLKNPDSHSMGYTYFSVVTCLRKSIWATCTLSLRWRDKGMYLDQSLRFSDITINTSFHPDVGN